MIGLIAILLTAVIIALVSINMGVIGGFTNSEKLNDDKAKSSTQIEKLNKDLLEIEKKSDITKSVEQELNE